MTSTLPDNKSDNIDEVHLGSGPHIYKERSMKHIVVAVVGLGYVGLPTAIALRNAGCHIIGIDTWPARVTAIQNGEAELLDSEQQDLQQHLQEDSFVLTDKAQSLDAADLILICVPTPVDENLQPDLAILRSACASVVEHAREDQTIVLTSTTYVGTTQQLLVEPLESKGLIVGEDVFVAFAPERIDPGVTEHTQLQTPRVVGGVTEECFERAAAVLRHTCKNLHRVSSPEAAEMVKLYENTFRAVNIALSFEMAQAAQVYGLNPIEITEAAATKPYGFMAHYPSAGVGGHCIAVDPYYLTHDLRERGEPATMIEEAMNKVSSRPTDIVLRSLQVLSQKDNKPAESRVLIVGVSYKPGIADTREAPALEIMKQLDYQGVQVDYYDPLVPELTVAGKLYQSIEDKTIDYDLVLIATQHPGYDYTWLDKAPVVLDCTYRSSAGNQKYLP
jgi:UDP-N-acetyl-D-glucosamine dehydrogenase